MARTLTFFTAALAALMLAAPAVSKDSVTITIRHQMRGCHTWSVNNGPYKVAQTVVIKRGSSITFVDNDVMPHKLIKSAGPALKLPASAAMSKMGASTRIVFSTPGAYKFTTKPGEDYMKGVMTMGEDNVLTLTVVVT
jgi:plastocyanin